MSRYRKIEVRTWTDEKFRRLSPLPPSGQSLWFFLLTGPHTSPIPGLFRAGRAAMSEELGWDQKGFDEAFGEVSSQGMAKADFKERLVWLPNALRHNKPESPNVIRSWRSEMNLLPECALKKEAYAAMRSQMEAWGDGFLRAFDECCGIEPPSSNPSGKASAKPSPKPSPDPSPNQEQEQEQEQEKAKARDSLRSSLSAPTAAPTAGDDPKPAKAPRAEATADPQPKQATPPTPTGQARAERLVRVTDEATEAYNRICAKPAGLMPKATRAGRDTRQANTRRCVKVARQICLEQFESDLIVPEFWERYFTEVQRDEFQSGRAWTNGGVPDFEYVTRPAVMLKIFERAVSQ